MLGSASRDVNNSDFVMDTISKYIDYLSPSGWASYVVSSFLALAALYLAISIPPQIAQPTPSQTLLVFQFDYLRLAVVGGLITVMAIAIIFVSRWLNNKRRALMNARTFLFLNRDIFDGLDSEVVKEAIKVLNDVVGSRSPCWNSYVEYVQCFEAIVKPQA
jgi:hypothetical protein